MNSTLTKTQKIIVLVLAVIGLSSIRYAIVHYYKIADTYGIMKVFTIATIVLIINLLRNKQEKVDYPKNNIWLLVILATIVSIGFVGDLKSLMAGNKYELGEILIFGTGLLALGRSIIKNYTQKH